ncbi:MAG: response regulator receiver protein [Cycloclasticus sp. symbiont of Bathymodiolus heckerae]|nr:MAG: response regulator receiver protein [Cycloclasticus sp. symbiont of Bathymodiolus heckerae]
MNTKQEKKGFSQQLNMAFLIGVIFMSLASAAFISYVTYERERAAYIDHGKAVLNALNNQLSVPFSGSLEELLSYSFKSSLEFTGVQKLVIFDEDFKKTFALKRDKDYELISGWQDVKTRAAHFERETEHGFYFTASVTHGSAAYVMLILDKRSVASYAKTIFFTNAGIILLLALLLLGALNLVIRRLTKPLEAFSSMMIQAASGETGLRTYHDASAELNYMSESFNQMMDMIEKKHLELETSRDQAVQIAKVKSDFAANVSHEIRTPLNGILGMVNLLKEMGLPQHQHEYLEVASKSGDSLLQMINDVLDFSKIEAGHFELELKDLDLRLLLEQLALLYAEKIQVKDLELCLDLPTDEVLFVRGDSTRIRQVVSNLLNNAIKFTSDGHITLSAHVVSQAKGTALINISVTDTGTGIPDESLEEIFRPFGQVSAETTNEYGGTGLGLTIVSEMTELMGGSVSVTSELGVGSRFQLLIPMQAHSIALEESVSEVKLLAGKSVLLIEPFKETRIYIEGMFKRWDISYQVVESLDEATVTMNLELESGQMPNICLFNVDYSAGNMSSFLENFKNGERFSETQLIPMIRFGSKISSVDGEEVPFTGSIDRPVRYDKLRMTLLDVFAGNEDRAKAEVKTKTNANIMLQSLNVLVVDDNATNQLVATAMLNEVADNGKEALRMFKEKGYDLILMDCNMPVMDGHEATKAIRGLDSAVKQPVIVALTAKEQKLELDACIKSGMNDCLSKPFQLSELLAVLEKEFGYPLSEDGLSDIELESVDGSIIVDSVFKALVVNTGSGIQQIVHSYLLDMPIYIVTLTAAMEAGDTTKCLDLAHKIKGSSRNLGAEDLVSVCIEVEETWAQKLMGDSQITTLNERLESEFSLVEAALNARLATLEMSIQGQAKRNKEVVLIVDDDQSTRMTVANVLEREGYQVELGANGRDAVRLFEILRPNVVIMDAMMPIKDGFEACREIKAMPGGESVPILITTALESEKAVDLAFESGAADFVPKPINLSVLRQRVKRLLAKQSADKHVQKLAYKDSLTGLPNRAAFVEQFQQELEHAKRNNTKTAIFFIDLDRFKNINDSLGHEAGDVLLKALSGRLANCIRSGDMLARIGGDEFVVVLSNMTDISTPDLVARSMLTALKDPFNLVGNEVFAGVSIGIAIYPNDGLSKDTLLKNADTAMYRAKSAGRNTYRMYTQEMSEVLEQRMRIESELRKVLCDNELSLYFQPKQDTTTHKIIGSEALVRWHHHLRGMVSPAEFIPVAEEMGLIKEIGLWVLDTACATTKKWQDEHGYYGSVAVNVSAVQMAEENFVSLVATCLDKYELDPKYLELEVTETMVLENIDSMLEKLNQIKDMGVSISIDDFGTGYSSFSYIKKLPASTLKLDMEFIKDIPENEADKAVVDGMIVLAHNLGMKVVAEGVESQEQYDFLTDHKCDLIQGYFINKPLSEEAFVTEYMLPSDDEKHLH